MGIPSANIFNNANLNKGSNIFALIPENNLLITANTDGFMLINLKRKNIYKRIHCKYSVSSLDMLSNDTFVCCTSQDNKKRIKQYYIDKKNCLLMEAGEIL